jgi:carboxyl-terminal processing protease
MQRLKLIAIGAMAGTALVLLANTPGLAPLIAGAEASSSTEAAETYRQLELFGQVYDIVRHQYVDKPDDTKLIESAVNGMVSGLDPHSNYMDANNLRDMQTETSGQFGGLGMQVTMKDGLVTVVAPLDDTPASRADIRAGDVITKVDGQPVAGRRAAPSRLKSRGRTKLSRSRRLLREKLSRRARFTSGSKAMTSVTFS